MSQARAVQAVRGMNDLLPADSGLWAHIERTARSVFESYGFAEIRMPVVEKTDLYRRSIGEVTDIVEKEMYSFEDRNGDNLTLRPEGTAGCVRAGVEHGLLHNQIQRLWYTGPMFRHERPQKGRYRQFHQIGAEVFGLAGPDVDTELLLLTARLWGVLGLTGLQLELNTLGTPESRVRYREALVAYLESRRSALDEDSLRRLTHNPLRILDSKNPDMQDVIAGAPALAASLDATSHRHFDSLRALLDANGLAYVVNPRLVRGLDYYSHTVFEWTTTTLGAQATACAGGRYDSLVETLGGKATPAVGFALGVERLAELCRQQSLVPLATQPQVYVLPEDEVATAAALNVAEEIREGGLRVLLHCGGGSEKSRTRRADVSGAGCVLFVARHPDGEITLRAKSLRNPGAVVPLARTGLLTQINLILNI